jgi:hypothetical protein
VENLQALLFLLDRKDKKERIMIREIQWNKGIAPELLKDETHIKVRMFDEKPSDSEVEDIVNADRKEMLMKKAACSYCGTEPAIGISWLGPSIKQATGMIVGPMFTFSSC